MHIYIRALILCNKMHANYIYRQKMEDKISEYKTGGKAKVCEKEINR